MNQLSRTYELLFEYKNTMTSSDSEMSYLKKLQEKEREYFEENQRKVVMRINTIEKNKAFDISKVGYLPEDIIYEIKQFLGNPLLELVRKCNVIENHYSNLHKNIKIITKGFLNKCMQREFFGRHSWHNSLKMDYDRFENLFMYFQNKTIDIIYINSEIESKHRKHNYYSIEKLYRIILQMSCYLKYKPLKNYNGTKSHYNSQGS